MAENLWRKAKLYQEQERHQEALDLMAQTISLFEGINYPHIERYRAVFNDLLRIVYTEKEL
jgi:hypothetical protein